MALSQRLEFRQTQALVMTPQLMQAIKLLQLSSLDLAAYVEAELEKNPLLERASDDDDAPAAAAEPEAVRAESAKAARTPRRTPDWIGEDMETSRSSMEEGLGTELENVFPDDGGEKARGAGNAAAGLFGMVGRRQPRRRGRRLQSGSLRLRRDHARRSSCRTDGAGDFRSGRPHDRAIPDRYGGRGRLPHRRSRRRRRKARRAARRRRGRARHPADARSARRVRAQSHRMPRHPAQGPRPLRSGDAHAGRASRSAWPSATSPPCAACAASTRRISPT